MKFHLYSGRRHLLVDAQIRAINDITKLLRNLDQSESLRLSGIAQRGELQPTYSKELNDNVDQLGSTGPQEPNEIDLELQVLWLK